MSGPHRPSEWDSVFGGKSSQKKGEPLEGAGKMGMAIFLASLSVLFLASLVGYFIVRSRAESWGPAGGGSYPKGLWVSTVVIVSASLTFDRALKALRADRGATFRRLIDVTLGLGIAFLVLQVANWLEFTHAGTTPTSGLYGFTFYLFTALHAAHVVGGLIPLAIVRRKAQANFYTPAHHAGAKYCAMYWHFLDVVWVVLFAVIVIG